MEKIRSKYKMVVFDIDGTILPGESGWETLHKEFGTINERNKNKKMFDENQIDILEWVKRDVSLWKERGITVNDISKVIQKRTPIKNIEKLLKILKENGFILAVVSGGLDIYFDTVLKDIKDYFDYIFINKLILDGDKVSSVEATIFDFDNKLNAVKKICSERNLDLKEVVYIGDNVNDTKVMKECGFGIAINPKSDLGDSPDVVVNTDDIMDVLKYIENAD